MEEGGEQKYMGGCRGRTLLFDGFHDMLIRTK